MKVRYSPRDYWHFGRMIWRARRRHKVWAGRFERAVREGSFRLPAPAVVQFIPTEACNLRCPFCNQWGEEGYMLDGTRKVRHMELAAAAELIKDLSPEDSFVNVHGGEPLAYRHIDALLGALAARDFDVLVTTNGTLIPHHLDALAGVRNLALILSVDGDEEAHDRVRGAGRFRQTKEGIGALFARRRELRMPMPLVIMSIVVCEWTTDVIEKAYDVAREFGVFALNYNLRYFMPEEAGLAYEKHLGEHFGLKSSGAWRGFLAPKHERHDYRDAADRLRRLLRRRRLRLLPPYAVSGPNHLRGADFESWFSDYSNTFGNESCFMPFYWARVLTNGDLTFCPGHPDIVAGNAFRDGLLEAFNSATAVKFRRHILGHRMPICNRCCGLYMTNPARPFEQRVRRRLGLPKQVSVDWP
ncbi:MAG TPA: radical SAM/SPASM domain-containing protein [Pyrinomonadaceae bacterium]|nr:radical SAM/SPASM domain-containing protein [Pyrinomonadaceae bacterium]